MHTRDSTSKMSIFTVTFYRARTFDELDDGTSRAFTEREEAFKFAYETRSGAPRGSIVCVEEISTDGLTAPRRYNVSEDEVWEIVDQVQEPVEKAEVAVDEVAALRADVTNMKSKMCENSLRVACVMSLLNLEANQKQTQSMAETALLANLYKPTSLYVRHLSQQTYHQTVKNDICELDHINEKLASWIQDLRAITKYDEPVYTLANLKPGSKMIYQPTIAHGEATA